MCGEGAINNLLQLYAGINDLADCNVALQKPISLDGGPIGIEGIDSRCIFRYVFIKDITNDSGDVFQDMAVLHKIDFIKYINISRVNRKQIHKFIHAGRHATIKAGLENFSR